MSGLRFPDLLYSELHASLLADRSREACAVGYAHFDSTTKSWVVEEAQVVPEDAYERRDAVTAVLKSSLVVDIANRSRQKQLCLVMIHTHPWANGYPVFSEEDNRGEAQLAAYFDRRAASGIHLALVIGPDGCRARELDRNQPVTVWEVGSTLALKSEAGGGGGADVTHDRQIRAFGAPGQRMLSALRVGIIGAGGTGSVLIQELAHLGVQDFTLVDPDTVEETNLNRLLGATRNDIGKAKIDVAHRAIQRINPEARLTVLQRDVTEADMPCHLVGLDFLFLCTDSHSSRAVVGQMAYQYLVPTIDMGVSITVRSTGVTHITGRVQMLSAGLPCLTCTGALDGEQIRQEMLTPGQRAADPYVQGVHEPQPAVISINSTISSLATTMFLGAVTPVPAAARFQMYDGIRGTVRVTSARKIDNCVVCSPSGSLARAQTWPLPVKQKYPTNG